MAPAFGQDGGGVQYRFFDENGETLSQGDLADRGIITKMNELRVHPPAADAASVGVDPRAGAAGFGIPHGLQSLDRLLTDYALPQGSR